MIKDLVVYVARSIAWRKVEHISYPTELVESLTSHFPLIEFGQLFSEFFFRRVWLRVEQDGFELVDLNIESFPSPV